MTYTSGISFLGQSNTQISRLKQLNTTLSDLQRQLTTQKKYDNISGFGAQSYSVQKMRTDRSQLNTFMSNATTLSTRMQMMSTTLQQASDSGRMLVETIGTQYKSGTADVQTVSTVARQQLDLMSDLANQTVDGRYIFAGSATSTEPFSSYGTLDMNMQNLMSDWQSGAITTAQFTAAISGMSDTDLGFDAGLSSAGSVTMQVDKNVNMDYTSVATDNGMKETMQALAIAANLTEVDPAMSPPGPTQADLDAVIDHILGIVNTGIEKTDAANAQIGIKYAALDNIQTKQTQDAALLDTLLIERENVDTTEVVAKIQSLQTQISASYEVTSLVSQLSLLNYL